MNGDEVIDPHPKSEELYLLLEGAGCAQDVIDYACHLVDEVARQSTIGKIAEEKFPSSPPDRPGWWRCRHKHCDKWNIVEVFTDRWKGVEQLRCVIQSVIDEPQYYEFAGRVEMPGEGSGIPG